MMTINKFEENMKPDTEILTGNPLFEGIRPEEIPDMLDCLQVRTMKYEKNQIIFSEGDLAEYVGILLTGSIFIMREDYFGNRHITTTLQAPELFGEVFACAETVLLPVSVIACEDSMVMLLNCKKILTVCGNSCKFHNTLIHNLLKVIARKNLMLNKKLNIITKRTTREKLMAFLMSEAKKNAAPAFTIPYNRQELADYLGVERSALSAEISRLCREGVLETKRSWFHIG